MSEGKMCNNCNCENYEKCSITGYMPIGFCCSHCYLYDENRTCLKSQMKKEIKVHKIQPLDVTIKNGVLKVMIEQNNEKFPIFIDLEKQLG
jgi:hypothetical protein